MNPTSQILEVLNQGTRDLQWFHQHKKELQEKYDEQFVAIKDRRILASCRTLPELIESLKKSKQNPANVLIEYVSKMVMIF
jgi:hypothetical protein